MKENLIYGLRDPRTDEYKYIGKSTCGMNRPKSHLVYSHNPGVSEWITELASKNLIPCIDIFEECENAEVLSEKEKFWVEFYASSGCDLFNINLTQYRSPTEQRLLKEIAHREQELENKLFNLEQEIKSLSTFGSFLRNRRKMLNLNQIDVSEILSVSLRTVSNIEADEQNVNFSTVINYFDILGYTLTPTLKKPKNGKT